LDPQQLAFVDVRARMNNKHNAKKSSFPIIGYPILCIVAGRGYDYAKKDDWKNPLIMVKSKVTYFSCGAM
jgi:hypothetical protein